MKKTTTYQSIIGGVLRIERQKKGFSLDEFAKKMEVAKASWSKAESGGSALNMEQIAKAAKLLGATPSDITQKADKIAKELEKEEGVEVMTEKDVKEGKSNLGVFLAGAALGAFLTAILSSSNSDEDK